eukprot:m51a1_g7089 hypothetical protein (176) ;mRNA; r:24338-24865
MGTFVVHSDKTSSRAATPEPLDVDHRVAWPTSPRSLCRALASASRDRVAQPQPQQPQSPQSPQCSRSRSHSPCAGASPALSPIASPQIRYVRRPRQPQGERGREREDEGPDSSSGSSSGSPVAGEEGAVPPELVFVPPDMLLDPQVLYDAEERIAQGAAHVVALLLALGPAYCGL